LIEGGRSVPYDYVILATGARHAYFGHDDWEPFAPGLKRKMPPKFGLVGARRSCSQPAGSAGDRIAWR